MLNDCPDPKEVSDFHFLQLRTLRVLKENERAPPKSINIVTSASKYDLLFVGVQGGFKVLRLDDILTLDEDKENRSILESYPFSLVSCDTPVLLAVNASQTVLAVCVKTIAGTAVKFYSLSNFPGFDSPWQPFSSKVLSSLGCELQDFVWNPALEGLYAYCLSDGSLHLDEISGTTIKPIASLSNANAFTVCWSPKGKQAVVGKKDGSFSQYKPSLDVVNTVPPPAFEDAPVSVSSICWISTTVFAVVYVANDVPNLFIVSTPKGGPVAYINFNDVCLGNNSVPDQKYLMHFEPSWGLLICASFDSIEIAVLGSMPNWVQWDLKEDGKALLPGKDGALNAVGMTVMYSAQKQIIISDSVSYAPMPVMFLLTNNGLLVSFHMVNERSDAATLVSAPLPTELKMCSANGLSFANISSGAEITEQKSFISPNQSLLSSTPIIGKNAPVSQILPSVSLPQNVSVGMAAKSKFTFSSGLESMNTLPGNQTVTSNLNKSEPVLANSAVEKNSQLQKSSALFASVKENEVPSKTENSYITAIISEIQSFEKELQDLKQLQNSLPVVCVEEDMTSLKTFALNLQNFQKDIAETMQSLSSEIYTLKNVLLEGFVLFEEASSRERRRNDHSYITMLKERALDPITARHMQKINQRYQYLSTQLQEVNNKLDQDWILHVSNKKKTSNFHISSTEAIYKTIVNNQKIIHNLRKKVDVLLERAEEKKLKNITNSGSWIRHHKRLPQEDLSKLADEFLQVKIAHQDEGEHTLTKKLSPDSQNFLRDFLRKSSVVTVRPTAVYSPSQSRLLSNTIPSDDSPEPDQTQVASPKIVSVVSDKEINDSPMSVNEALNASVVPRHLNESTPVNSYFPIYEPITPPETATTAPEPVNKTYTCLLREKEPEPLSCPSSVSTVLTSDQGICSSLLPSMKNKKELPKFSFVPEIKSAVFNQSTSEAISSLSSGFTQLKPLDAPLDSIKLSTSESVISTIPSLTNSSISVVTCSETITSQLNLSICCKPSSSPLVTLPVQSTSLSSTMKFGQIVSTTSLDSSKMCKSDAATLEVKQKQMIVPSQSASVPFFSCSKIVASTSCETPVTQTSGQQPPSTTVPQITVFGQSTSSSVTQTVSGQPTSTTVMQTNLFGQPLSTATTQTVSKASVYSSEACKPNVSSTSTFDIKQVQIVGQSQSGTLPLFSSPKTDVSSSNETSVTQSVFGQQLTSTSVPQVTLFNQSTATSVTQTTVSGQSTPTAVTQITVSGQSTPTTVTQTTAFGQTTSTTVTQSTVFGQSTPTTVTQTTVFGQSTPTTVTQTTVFGQSTPTTVTQTAVFGQSTPTTGTEAPVFNQSTPSTIAQINLFGQTSSTAVTQTALFGQPTSASVTQTLFGQPTSTSNFTSTSGGFFSQTPSFGASDTTAVTTASSDFNNQSSFSFGKPAFGQTTGSFGLAKSLFGQNANSFAPSSTPSSFSFNQNQGSGFGQGSFFSGLGGKPNEENASKNVFGVSSGIKSPDTNNLFKNSSVKSFGAANGNTFSGTGSFSSGGGSVAQSGFGSFQQNPTQQSVGAFGASPTFGGNPAFGSLPAFGGSPAFGSGNSLSPVFGQQQVSSNFSNFANASSPTFGSLATQSTGFGSSPGFGSPTFGSAPAFGTSSFGGQSSSFGSPSSPPSNSSAFTQWRN